MQTLPFDSLPQSVATLTKEVKELRQIVEERLNVTSKPEQYFNLQELCEYLPYKPAKQTIYGLVHSGKIPFKKQSKHLIFLRSEIDAWLQSK